VSLSIIDSGSARRHPRDNPFGPVISVGQHPVSTRIRPRAARDQARAPVVGPRLENGWSEGHRARKPRMIDWDELDHRPRSRRTRPEVDDPSIGPELSSPSSDQHSWTPASAKRFHPAEIGFWMYSAERPQDWDVLEVWVSQQRLSSAARAQFSWGST